MSAGFRRAVVVAVAVVVVAVGGSLVGWWLELAGQSPWAGLTYQPALESDLEGPLQGLLRRRAGVVTGVVPGSPAERAGLEVGDTIRSIGRVALEAPSSLTELSRTVRPGDTVAYEVERDGAVLRLGVTVGSMRGAVGVHVAFWSSLLVGVSFLAISLLVAWARPRSPSALLFFFASVAAAVSFVAFAFGEPTISGQQGIAPVTVEPDRLLALLGGVSVMSILTANLLLHLALVFPHRRPLLDRFPGVLGWVHTLPFLPLVLLAVLVGAVAATGPDAALAAVVLAAVGALVSLLLVIGRRVRERGLQSALLTSPWPVQGAVVAGAVAAAPLVRLLPSHHAVLAGALCGMAAVLASVGLILTWSVLTCVALHRSYREAGVEEQRQVRWPVWGTLVAMGGSLVAALVSVVVTVGLDRPQFAVSHGMLALNTAAKLLYVLIPVSFAFGIVKHRLLEIDVIIRKTVVWSAATGLVAVAYLVLAGVAGVGVVAATGVTGQVWAVVATLVAAALLVPARAWVQRLVDRRLGARAQDLDRARRQLAEAVAGGRGLGPVAAALADGIQRALQCRTVVLLGREADSDHLRPLATVGVPDPVRDRLELPVDALEGLAESRAVHLTVASPLTLDLARERRLDATLAAVGRHRGEPLALAVVGGRLDRQPYGAEEGSFLVEAAGQVALAVATFAVRRIDREVEQALRLQRSLLPRQLPDLEGLDLAAHWEPAREVSGDAHDLLRLDERRLALSVADVAGKGMPAALLMSSLQGAVRAAAGPGVPAEEVGERVRDAVTQGLEGGRFVTLVFAILDLERSTLAFVNAGHPPPLLLRADASAEWLPATEPVVARLFAGRSAPAAEVPVGRGDLLVLYSDGVTEATDGGGELFGEARLLEVVRRLAGRPAAEVVAGVAAAARAHGDGELQDDLTVVAARVL
ncbi:MAG: SpoIIE family protein phosphatase [Thermoanaerobaculaceae bacterium]|nr:SpoIIE family protein phosphatase [Thermoanaerobaculaceae bacterium]